MSTKSDGDAFRSHVAELLKASGYRSVTEETLIGHKQVDVYFEDQSLSGVDRYVVEAKNWNSNITKDTLVSICVDHTELINKNLADKILVIGLKPITAPAANNFLNENKQIAYLTFQDLQARIMDFRRYLGGMVTTHENEKVESYFMTSRCHAALGENDTSDINIAPNGAVEPAIVEWLEGDKKKPVAILAGYGMGKTTFARHISYVLAKQYIAGKYGRIPILIKLGDFASELKLEGLLGGLLTSGEAVTRYSFSAFDQLNRDGHFLIILDGFDEMKHTMTAVQFRSNFSELNRLVKGKARVLLLGRPSAFLSDHEQGMVLRGIKEVGGHPFAIPANSPSYQLLELDMFSKTEAREFIHRYIKMLTSEADHTVNEIEIDKRAIEVCNGQFDDLISRPVQARMLADLAFGSKVTLSGMSRYDLYNHFINYVSSEREMEKASRNSISGEMRRSFMGGLAWWLWTTGKNSGCSIEQLPEYLCTAAQNENSMEPKEAIRRDLMAGSMLEEKSHGIFYIPHRSFVEFLIAEHLETRIGEGEDISKDASYLNSNIVAFLDEGKKDQVLERFWKRLSENLNSSALNLDIFSALSQSQYFRSNFQNLPRKNQSPWHVFLAYQYATEETSDKAVIDAFIRMCEGANASLHQALAFCAVLTMLCRNRTFDAAEVALYMLENIAAHIDLSVFSWGDKKSGQKIILHIKDNSTIAAYILTQCFKKNNDASKERGRLVIEFSGSRFLRMMDEFFLNVFQLEDMKSDEELRAYIRSLKILFNYPATTQMPKGTNEKMREYFNTAPTIVVKKTIQTRNH